MGDDVRAASDAIRHKAKVWNGYADKMDTVATTVRGLHLDASAFTIFIDGGLTQGAADDLSAAYDKVFGFLRDVLTQAGHEFDTMGTALKQTADEYDRVDEATAERFDKFLTS